MTTKKKLLIAGGGYADIPLILAARELGFHVITSGNRAEDLGHRHSHQCRLADFSDPEAMLSLSQELRIDAICACCNDFSALSAAHVAERMGLPGHDSLATSKILHHKDLYRDFARKNGIATPQAEGFSSTRDALATIGEWPLPLIIKPVDLTGGKGITTIHDMSQAGPALDGAFSISRAKRVVVEEFLQGTRHGLSIFLRDGKVVFFFSDNEHYFKNPFLVSAASTPSMVSASVEQELCSESERIASLLSLTTGIFHIQYILRDGRPVIIEICRRAPGDLYIRFVEHATGVDYPSWIVRASAGLDCSGLSHVAPNGFFTRHCVMSSSEGRVRDVQFDESIRANIVDQYMWWKPGDLVDNVMTCKLGIVFLRFDRMEEMLDKTERMQELIRVEM